MSAKHASGARVAKCDICGGTGKIYAHNSWFIQDGFYRLRCGICGGSGESRYRDADYARFQHNARVLIGTWGALRPPKGADVDTALRVMNSRRRVVDIAGAA